MDPKYGYFLPKETSCRCGCGLDITDEMRKSLNQLRYILGRPLTITSGRRCEKHNAAVGGAKNSQHKLGIAADIIAETEKERVAIIAVASKLGFNGIGSYPKRRFIHVDKRKHNSLKPAIWTE